MIYIYDCCRDVQLVSTNEALEKEVMQLKEGGIAIEAMQNLQDTMRHLQAQNLALQNSISCKFVFFGLVCTTSHYSYCHIFEDRCFTP